MLTAAQYSHSCWDWLWSSHIQQIKILPTSAHLQKWHDGLLEHPERRTIINSCLVEYTNVIHSTCVILSRCTHFPWLIKTTSPNSQIRMQRIVFFTQYMKRGAGKEAGSLDLSLNARPRLRSLLRYLRQVLFQSCSLNNLQSSLLSALWEAFSLALLYSSACGGKFWMHCFLLFIRPNLMASAPQGYELFILGVF